MKCECKHFVLRICFVYFNNRIVYIDQIISQMAIGTVRRNKIKLESTKAIELVINHYLITKISFYFSIDDNAVNSLL